MRTATTSLLAALSLGLAACTTALPADADGECTDGLCDQEDPETGSPQSPVAIVPVIVDDAALGGLSYPESRSVYADLQDAITAEGARVTAYMIRFGNGAEDHPATRELEKAFADFQGTGGQVVLQEREGISPSLSYGALVGHGTVGQSVFSYRDTGEQALAVNSVLLEGSDVSLGTTVPLSVAGIEGFYRARGDADPRSAAVAQARCNAIETEPGNLSLVAADVADPDLAPILDQLSMELEESPFVRAQPAVLASELLSGRQGLPPNAIVFVGTALPSDQFGSHDANIDLTYSTFAEVAAWGAAAAMNPCP